MIDPKIIEKLKMVESTQQIGNSFMYNVLVYETGIDFGVKKVYFSEAEMNGRPNNANFIFCFAAGDRIVFSQEFLIDQPAEIIIECIRQEINRALKSREMRELK